MKNFENGIHAFINNAGNIGAAVFEIRIVSEKLSDAIEQASILAENFIESNEHCCLEKVLVSFEDWDEQRARQLYVAKCYVFEKFY